MTGAGEKGDDDTPGAWYDAHGRGKGYSQLLEGLKSGRLLEFEVKDVMKTWRGNLLGEILGQTLEGEPAQELGGASRR